MTALHGKAAIVGGSSAGIGYAIARRLAPYDEAPAAPRPDVREQPVEVTALDPATPKLHAALSTSAER